MSNEELASVLLVTQMTTIGQVMNFVSQFNYQNIAMLRSP